MRAISVLVALIAATPASALTCKNFRASLAKAIADGGHRVATPVFEVIPGAAAQPDTKSVVGLETLLTCSDADRLQSIDITATIDSDDEDENLQRHLRFDALVGAALCAIEPKSSQACYATAQRSQSQAIKDFMAAKKRGEPQPFGLDIVTVRHPDVAPAIKAFPGSVTFTVDLTE